MYRLLQAKDEVPELNIKKQVDFVTEKSTKKRILKSSKEDGHDKKLLVTVQFYFYKSNNLMYSTNKFFNLGDYSFLTNFARSSEIF
jgi:hypothetical protein